MVSKNQKQNKIGSLRTIRGQTNVTNEYQKIYTVVKRQIKNKGGFMDLITDKCNRKGLLINNGK